MDSRETKGEGERKIDFYDSMTIIVVDYGLIRDDADDELQCTSAVSVRLEL